MEKRRNYSIQSVTRAFQILESLKERPSMGVTQLSKELGLHKSTVYHLLATLVSLGYIEQDEKRGKYSMSLKVFELGSVVVNRMELKKEALPFIKELSQMTQETVNLVTLAGHEVIYIEKIESQDAIRINTQVGRKVGLYCSAVGKVILAYLPEERRETILSQIEFEPITPHTILSQDELLKELKEIRERGYGLDNEEIFVGIKCIAAPIFDQSREVSAAISLTGPLHRINEKKEERLGALVMEVASKISRRLGYRGSNEKNLS